MKDAERPSDGVPPRADGTGSRPGAGHTGADADPPAGQFRHTLVRVLVIQAVALLALWLLQVRYTV